MTKPEMQLLLTAAVVAAVYYLYRVCQEWHEE